MSEKIIVLHPENQPEVDIYPIIKEGSIPNSVIDNQKIKSRTIINSNIALNTLKYEVLHQTLKDLIDSKITQANMENYLSSYYYNVEETQQYVGSEINTLHQTIQNEFYSNTAIDDMLLEKTDLSLFRQYLPSTYLNLDKQQDNQTSKLNIHANGSIFLMNSGNKTNSGNYYFPNSIVKTEDAPNGYFVLSTTNDDYQSLYNLGYYDKITTNDDGTYTITRQTGYLNSNDLLKASTINCNPSNDYVCQFSGLLNVSSGDFTNIICNLLPRSWSSSVLNRFYVYNNSIYLKIDGLTTTDAYKQYVSQNNLFFQYKLTTSYTEKVEKNHYARYNQDFILEHNKSEAERSANLWKLGDVSVTSSSGEVWKRTNRYLDLEVGTYQISVTNNSEFNYILIATSDGTLVEGTKKTYKFTLSNKSLVTFGFYANDGNAGSRTVTYSNIMLNEGSIALPYQPYEGKTIHEKDLNSAIDEKQDKLVSGSNIKKINGNDILGSGNITIGTIPIYNVSQLYRHYYELEAKPSDDTIYVTCWSTKPDKILLEDITRYAFSNVQVYNSGNNETIQVIKWTSTGFNYINNDGNIDGMGYIVLHYYINSEPTPY